MKKKNVKATAQIVIKLGVGWVWPQSADHLALLQNELEAASRVGEGEPDVTVAGHYLGARP